MVEYLKADFGLGIRQACQALRMATSSFYYKPHKRKKASDQRIMDELKAWIEKRPTIGFWALFRRLRRKGFGWNHKRVYRIYKQAGLNLRPKKRKRLPERIKQPIVTPAIENVCWSMDFMSDGLRCGRTVRLLNILDDFNREALVMEADTSMPSQRVLRILNQLISWRGIPQKIRVDNGPEFISHVFKNWCETKGIEICHTQPGKPTQNALVERFNGSVRREFLNVHQFKSVEHMNDLLEEWMIDYNAERPHDSLGNQTPWEYLYEKKVNVA